MRLFLPIFAFLTNCQSLEYSDVLKPHLPHEETYLLPEDFINANKLKEIPLEELLSLNSTFSNLTNSTGDPILRAGKFEGDILGHNSTSIHQYAQDVSQLGRNAVRGQYRLWPDSVIPYLLSSQYGEYSRQIIAKAMEEYTTKTCIKFKPRSEETDYIYIFPDEGCYSLVGRTGGKQPVSLDAGCIQVGTVIHELMHADRDDYIDIQWANIDATAQDQFEKYNLRTIQYLGASYDYNSIMHYGAFAFTSNGQSTIIAKKSGGDRMGQREGFSQTDLDKINRLYQCDPTQHNNPTPKPTGATSKVTSCVDKTWRCKFWRIFGFCTETYYKLQCPSSCSSCLTANSNLKSTSSDNNDANSETEESSNAAGCEDLNPSCEKWSKNHYCSKDGFTRYMESTCPKSCAICNDYSKVSSKDDQQSNSECVDIYSKCKEFAEKNYCDTKNSATMSKFCRKSCGKCGR